MCAICDETQQVGLEIKLAPHLRHCGGSLLHQLEAKAAGLCVLADPDSMGRGLSFPLLSLSPAAPHPKQPHFSDILAPTRNHLQIPFITG